MPVELLTSTGLEQQCWGVAWYRCQRRYRGVLGQQGARRCGETRQSLSTESARQLQTTTLSSC